MQTTSRMIGGGIGACGESIASLMRASSGHGSIGDVLIETVKTAEPSSVRGNAILLRGVDLLDTSDFRKLQGSKSHLQVAH